MRFSRTTGVLTAAAALAAAVTIPTAAFADTPTTPGAMTASTAHAASVPTDYRGLKMTGKGGVQWWVGSVKYTVKGQTIIGDCVIPGANLLTPTNVRTGVYGSKRESAELSYILYYYGTSPSDAVAAGGRLAALKIVGKSIPGLQVPAKIAAYARNDVLNAQRYAGKATASVLFGSRPTTPGQSAGVKLDIVSAEGREIPGIPVRFTAGSASLTAGGVSGGWKNFTRTSESPVWVEGEADVPSPEQVTIGTVPNGQTLIGEVPATVEAKSVYQNHPVGVKSTVFCNCDGTANITGHVSQAAGATEGQYTMLANGKAVASVTITAGKHGQAAVLKAENVADGALVTFTARYKVDGKWTPVIALGGTFKNVCPVMPRVSFTTQCNCKPGTSTYTDKAVVAVANPSRTGTDTVNYTVDGVKHTLTVAPGASKTAAFTVPSGPVSFAWSWTASI